MLVGIACLAAALLAGAALGIAGFLLLVGNTIKLNW
jgi:hypothetical protein